jgi:ribosomal protein S27AE
MVDKSIKTEGGCKMLPASIALWALFSVQTGKDASGAIDKLVTGEPKPSDVIADSYVAAVKQYSKLPFSVKEKIDKIALICRAVWEIVRERYGLSDEDLLNKVKEIDLLDGVLDGKVSMKPLACPKCGRTVSARRMRCIYCGTNISKNATAFDLL